MDLDYADDIVPQTSLGQRPKYNSSVDESFARCRNTAAGKLSHTGPGCGIT